MIPSLPLVRLAGCTASASGVSPLRQAEGSRGHSGLQVTTLERAIPYSIVVAGVLTHASQPRPSHGPPPSCSKWHQFVCPNHHHTPGQPASTCCAPCTISCLSWGPPPCHPSWHEIGKRGLSNVMSMIHTSSPCSPSAYCQQSRSRQDPWSLLLTLSTAVSVASQRET